MSKLWSGIERLGGLADRASDTDEERQRHRFLLITGVSMGFGGVVWGRCRSSRVSTGRA